jgi:hypothetical protein
MFVEFYNLPRYYQIWDYGGVVHTYEGIVGERRVLAPVPLHPNETVSEAIRRLESDARGRGFAPLPSEQYHKLVVSFSIDGWEVEDVSAFEEMMRSDLGIALAQIGNGLYDGYSLEFGRLSCWCLVINLEAAIKAITAELDRCGYLTDPELDVVISVHEGDTFRRVDPTSRDS